MHLASLVTSLLAVVLLLVTPARPAWANQLSNNYVSDYEMEQTAPLLSILELISKLRQTNSIAEDPAAKRGLDLGINRGFSGAQAAKHLMGLAAAQYAAGPGRRRRDTHQQPQQPAGAPSA
ncbi:diuretic hormone class 2 [Schistocerca nitens]|uniref:diuretic hormone class 2 n=1 Tax=Schistocerca nitens TaxID=7011 RepID=UPI00211876D4|nr:diuretic hormone class 2 [Schistocerca nitens]